MFGSVDKYRTKKGVKYRLRYQGQTLVFDTRAEVDKYRLDVAAKRKGGVGQKASWLIDEFLADCLARVEAKEPTLEFCSYRDYKFGLKNYIALDELSKLKLNDVDAPAVEMALSRIEKKVSASLLKRVRTHLSVMFGWAVTKGYMVINPAREVRLRGKTRHAVPADDLSFDDLVTTGLSIPAPDQVKKIIAAADAFDASGRAGLQVRMLFFGGLRPSEMLGFPARAQKIAPDGRLLAKVVQRSENQRTKIGRLKNASSLRTVILGKDAGLAMRKYLMGAGIREGLLFPTKTKRPIAYSNFHRRVWQPILKAALGDDVSFTPHHGRHFAISALIAAGAKPKRVQGFAGHATLQITMDTYGHLFPDDEADSALADAINDMVKRA